MCNYQPPIALTSSQYSWAPCTISTSWKIKQHTNYVILCTEIPLDGRIMTV